MQKWNFRNAEADARQNFIYLGYFPLNWSYFSETY